LISAVSGGKKGSMLVNGMGEIKGWSEGVKGWSVTECAKNK